MTEQMAFCWQVRALFDAKAATWSGKYSPGGRLTGRLAWLAAALREQAPPGCAVLDLGCGTGDLARHLGAVGLRVTGCDISTEMLERAAQADPAGTVEWIELDPGWRTLPFPTAAFGAIVASSVLEYVSDPAVVLRECARVLAPGGTLLCTIPDLRHPVRWLEWLLRLATWAQPRHAVREHLPRLDAYLVYLRISRHRRPASWWYQLAEPNGLNAIAPAVAPQGLSPLRLVAFRRSDSRL